MISTDQLHPKVAHRDALEVSATDVTHGGTVALQFKLTDLSRASDPNTSKQSDTFKDRHMALDRARHNNLCHAFV